MISCSDWKKQKKILFDMGVSSMKSLGFSDREAYIDTRSVQLLADKECITLAKEFGVTPAEMYAERWDIRRRAEKLAEERDSGSP